ncbi:MAG: leucine-rich repeat domain-containing protein, partial [Bacteroidales bacterium]|nr:leucine-rich repeat domain-containing protein [Bacteroidales bacterium]
IGEGAYSNCDRLVNVTLSDNARRISNNAFQNCFRLQNINLGKNIDTIGKHAFEGCIRLNKPLFSDSLQYIGDSAFRRCRLFDSLLTIPSKVNYIGQMAFDSCINITAMKIKAETPPIIFANTFKTIDNNIPVYVPCEKVIDYYTTDNWENFPNISEYSPFEINVFSENDNMGKADVIQDPTCNNHQTIIKATANDSYHFVKWNDGNGNNPRIFFADSDTNFTAIFMQNTAFLTIHSNDSVMGNVTGTGLYEYRQNVIITANPKTNYHFLKWSDGSTDNPRIILATQDSSFTAIFVSNISNVSVLNNNTDMGTVNGSGVYYYQNQIVISATANYGYHFTQWDDGNTDNPRTIQIDRDSVFRANFAVNIYSLSINSSNTQMGYTYGTGNYNYLATVGISATANYGYHFSSWSDGNENNPRTLTIERDSSFTAQFVANSYYINTEANDPVMGSVYGGGSYSYNSQKIISASANYGYHFTQWNDGNTDNPRTITITNNANYIALFAINTYDIITNSSNPAIGTASGGGTYEYNTPVNISANANYGYHFTQWSDGNTDNPRLITVIQNTTYTAQFTLNSYTIEVESNSSTMGSTRGNGAYLYNSVATISAIANYGYHFISWSDGNTENPRSFIVTKNENITALFDYNLYNISASSSNLSQGSILGSGTYNFNSVISLTALPSEHYHFLRWNDYITDNPRTISVVQDSVFTAYFEIDTHRVSLVSVNANMGTVEGDGYFNYGSLQNIVANANYGYHFTHWSDNNPNNPRNLFITQDTNLIAYFIANDYEVVSYTTDTNQGTIEGNGIYGYLSHATLTATAKYGYHFVKWSDENTDNPRNITVVQDISLYAVFEPNVYNLLTQTNSDYMGTVTGAGEYNYMTNISLTAIPNEHHHFISWCDGITQNPRNIILTKDSIFTAIFELENHIVSLNINNQSLGIVTGAGVYNYGEEITISCESIAGHHFLSWQDGNTDNPRNVIITQDTNFIATCVIDTFIVEVRGNDTLAGNVTGSGAYTYNEQISISATANEHYHFISWNDGNTSNPRLLTVDKDSVFIALFSENERYNLQVISNNTTMGEVYGSGVYYAGERIEIKAIANEHHHFISWQDGNTDNPRFINLVSDYIYVANFSKNVYTLRVESENLNMGTTIGSGEYEYKDIAVISAISEEGYKFLQWNDGNTDNPREITVEDNATFIANFEKYNGVGLTSFDEHTIILYPNPAKDYIIFEYGHNISAKELKITDIIGRTIAIYPLNPTQIKQIINISDYKKGTYIYYYGNISGKFIVK